RLDADRTLSLESSCASLTARWVHSGNSISNELRYISNVCTEFGPVAISFVQVEPNELSMRQSSVLPSFPLRHGPPALASSRCLLGHWTTRQGKSFEFSAGGCLECDAIRFAAEDLLGERLR